MAEIIPLPADRASKTLPIHIESNPDSFPERFAFRFDWNPIVERWVMEIEHLAIDRIVVKNMVTPYFPYWYDPYILFMLIDPSGQQMMVTPDNLGDDIKLFAFPGPAGQPQEEQ
jgi:hypothetical protein